MPANDGTGHESDAWETAGAFGVVEVGERSICVFVSAGLDLWVDGDIVMIG